MQQFIKEIARGKRGSTDLTYEQAKSSSLNRFWTSYGCSGRCFLLRNVLKPKMQMNYWDSFMLFAKNKRDTAVSAVKR